MKLISKSENIFYLTGFQGSFGLVFSSKNRLLLMTDSRYKISAEALGLERGFDVEMFSPEAFSKALNEKSIEYEEQHVNLTRLKMWKKWAPNKKWKAMQKGPQETRMQKTQEELEIIQRSQALNEIILSKALAFLRDGCSEVEMQSQLKILALQEGIQNQAFEPIVAFGENSAIPHHQSGDRQLKKGDLILIDMGQKYKNYASDMTRCFFWKSCKPEEAAIYNKVLEAQKLAIQEIKIGASPHEIEELVRNNFGELASHFTHSLGHGIGLEVHERLPKLYEEANVSTVEPGLYFDHKIGVRIEDMGVVTKDGFVNFTTFPKELTILS